MRVLGIDPGTANTGFGVVASAPGRLTALTSGVRDDVSITPEASAVRRPGADDTTP